MCIISGYIGTKQAAPILIEMMRKEEGLDAGYYTGIATIHEGKIHYRKLEGNLDTLLEKTDAASLPGTIGFLHSRTPGQPYFKDLWAHPFTCEKDSIVETALIENGILGCKRAVIQENTKKLIPQLLDEGFQLKSAITSDPAGAEMPNGQCAHVTDVVTQYASRQVLQGTDTVTALANTMETIPIEAICLFLNRKEPDCISWARTNFPMHVAFAPHGAYLATTPLAFPEDAGQFQLLPALSSGQIRKDCFSSKPFPNPPFSVSPITPDIWNIAYQKIVNGLKTGQGRLSFLFEQDFEPADCTPKNAVYYQIMAHLYKKGYTRIERTTVPGHNSTTATKYTTKLIRDPDETV